jgi:hypothetical protein
MSMIVLLEKLKHYSKFSKLRRGSISNWKYQRKAGKTWDVMSSSQRKAQFYAR